MNISSLSLEDVSVPIASSPADPTGDAVQMAFTTFGADPGSGDWHTASWVTSGGVHSALCLVGPTAVVLAKGYYWIWAKITDNPEVPVIHVGTLIVE